MTTDPGITAVTEVGAGGAPSGSAGPAGGLSTAEVAKRVAAGATNDAAPRSSRSTREIVLANTLTPFNLLLGSLLAVVLVVGPLQDALFGLVILSNAAVGIWQELRAKRTLDRLAVVGEALTTVRRDGRRVELPSREVVLDDLILLQTGDHLVVDGTVTLAAGLELDESLLTGEADPVEKHPGQDLLSGSFVVAGSGEYRATRVGAQAFAARIADEAKVFSLPTSELRSGIDRIIRTMAVLMVPVGLLLLATELATADGIGTALKGTVAALVTMVPEGLVLLTSMAFALGVIRLGRLNVLVQELAAVEGLARVDVVGLDKTGTLTEPVMRVVDVVLLAPELPVRHALSALAAADPHPNASLNAIAAALPAPPPGWAATAVEPFSSARKWSGASFDTHGRWVLGAPEILLDQADPALTLAAELAGSGRRVLLVGLATQPSDGAEVPGPIRAAGLVALEQPVRPDAPATLRYFADQDVAVKVISGDSPATVGAIARRLQIPGGDEPVDARELPEQPEQLAEVLETRSVFGRVSPQQKRSMVTALQSRGHTVAMAGDGVNDVLALKAADIGMAMGNGSDATRAVAQIVLLDSSFAVMPRIVAEGRRVIGNVERVANLFLAKTVYATIMAVAVIVTQLPFPFLPRHLTLVSTLTIGIPGLVLALLPNTDRVRTGFVRRVLRFALPSGIVAAAASFGAYAAAYIDQDVTRQQAQTQATIVLFAVALWILAIVARPITRITSTLLATMVLGFAAALAIPWTRQFFALELPGWFEVAEAALVTAAAVALLEVGWRAFGWRDTGA